MPLYEFICEECGETFEELVLGASKTSDVICPACTSELVRKLMSSFSASIKSSSSMSTSLRSAESCSPQSA